MTLSKESADAFRQCLRILAPRCTPEERRVQSRNVESYIAEGKWIPALLVEDIALLFYPHDLSLESAMLIKMKAAIETQELISTPKKKDVLMASDLASWLDCPPVPHNSPLRYWLPNWMLAPHADNAPDHTAVMHKPTKVTPVQRSAAQDAAIVSELKKLRCDPTALPQNERGKAGVKSKVRAALKDDRLFTGSTVFDKAWERLSRNGDIVIQSNGVSH